MNRDLLQSRILRRITLRYIFAVCLISILALSTFLYNQYIHQKKIEDYQVINLTGRQRMLSQRIALLSLNGRSEELGKSIREFHTGLNYLKSTRFVSKEHPEVFAIYEGIEEGVDKLIELAATPMTPVTKETLFQTSQIMLKKFDRATLLKQKISEEEFRNSSKLEGIFLGSTLVLLLLEVLFIFRPMTEEVRQTFKDLNDLEDKSIDSARLALIGHTAATIGHEIKNPLFAILAYSKLSGGNNEIKFQKILKNAERIKKIIDALSVQARESSHDERVSSSLRFIMDDALDILDPRIKSASITIKREEHFQGEIVCKPSAISQVFANVIANAVDAIKDSKIKEIKIESGSTDDYIFIRISDSGPGVPVELQKEIFKSFMTTKKQGTGSGLGLSFCKKIMQEHEGDLELRPEISPSCFEMRFPIYLSIRA